MRIKSYLLFICVVTYVVVNEASDLNDKLRLDFSESESESEQCEDAILWESKDDVLTISGSGEMCDHAMASYYPWYSYRKTTKRIVIQNGVTSLGSNAFRHFTNVESVSIADSVLYIKKCALSNCSSLTELSLPRKLKTIGDWCFEACSSLTSVTIPKSVTTIGNAPFEDCENLVSVFVEDGSKNYQSVDGVLISKKGVLTQYPCGKSNSYTFPECVTSVKAHAFCGCFSLESVTLNDGLKTIGKYAFNQCRSLRTVTIPESVESMDEFAFHLCTSLVSIFYEGSKECSQTSFYYHNNGVLQNVCVSPDYPASTLCGVNVTSSELCQLYQSNFNHCFKARYIDGDTFIQEKRKNTTEWENHTNVCMRYDCNNETGPNSTALVECNQTHDCYEGKCNTTSGKCEYDRKEGWSELIELEDACYEVACKNDEWVLEKRMNATKWESLSDNCVRYECSNVSGPIVTGLCNSGDKNLVCVNGECVDNTTATEKQAFVEIVLDESIKASETNMTDLLEMISEQCDIDAEDIILGYVTDDDGNIISILVYVNDEQTAISISEAINEMADKKGDCKIGILCKKKKVNIVVLDHQISGISSKHLSGMVIVTMLLIVAFI